MKVKALEDILTDDGFWASLADLLAQRMTRMNARALVLGLQAAADEGVVFDADALFAEGLRRAREAGTTWSRQMVETTREALRQALETWQATGGEGDATPMVMDALAPMFGQDRAERVGATETTRLFNDGGALAMMWDDMIQGQIYTTAADEKVCAVCGPKDGLIYPKGQAPSLPLHVNCRCSYRPANWRYISQHPKAWQGQPIAFEVRLG